MRTWLAVATLVALAVPAGAAEHSFWWKTKAQAACLSDVLRLCRSDMPDEDKITACMTAKRAQVSAGCLSYFPGGENAE